MLVMWRIAANLTVNVPSSEHQNKGQSLKVLTFLFCFIICVGSAAMQHVAHLILAKYNTKVCISQHVQVIKEVCCTLVHGLR